MKALALLSGGLDSILAIRVIKEQGIDVEAINFVTPFCQCSSKGCGGHAAGKAAEKLGVPLTVRDISYEFMEIVKRPKHGYGKNMNPCIDCRILMNRKAAEYMKDSGTSFIITGEVLGQRPMSQHMNALRMIEKESGLSGLILRPLSAKLLPVTTPEKEGWVDRERLLDMRGRTRKPQMALAEGFNIKDYPCPAGGCLLTDPEFARKIRDLFDHTEATMDDIHLLKVGRHFRLSQEARLVVGRDEGENKRLLALSKEDDVQFKTVDVAGPVGIGRGSFGEPLIHLSSRIIARYSDSARTDTKICVSRRSAEERDVIADKIDNGVLSVYRI